MKITKSGSEWFKQDFDPEGLIADLRICVELQSRVAAMQQDAARLDSLLQHLEVEDGLPDGSLSALTNAAWDFNERRQELEYAAKARINGIIGKVALLHEYVYWWENRDFKNEVDFIRQQQADLRGEVYIAD